MKKLLTFCVFFLACDTNDNIGNDIVGEYKDPTSCTNTSECNDGDPCTVDTCVAGHCRHEKKDCDDKNICTEDLCEESGKCVHIERPGCCTSDAECDDDNPCTKDTCKNTVCLNDKTDPTCCNSLKECDDQNECTLDNCNNHKCEHIKVTGPNCCSKDSDCLDSNPCTADVCKDGKCVHTNTGCCSDDADCTSDGNPCHSGKCQNGKCVFTQIPGCCQGDADCNDQNDCTADTCVVGHCQYVSLEACCTSDNQCAVMDPCKVGVCHIPEGSSKGSCVIKLVNTPECCTATLLTASFDGTALDGFQVVPLFSQTVPTWQKDSKRYVSPPSSLYFGDPTTHTYKSQPIEVGAKVVSPPLDLAKTSEPELRFQLYKNTDMMPSSDVLSVVVTTAGSDTVIWSTAQFPQYSNTFDHFVPVTVSLGAFAGKKVALSFVFESLYKFTNKYEGVYIDDVEVIGKCQ